MKFTRQDVKFHSGRDLCAAWLYLPEDVENPPVVVMAHGFSGIRTLWLDLYAERFVAHGLAAFVFDYRHFGDSEGHPRQVVNIKKQLADWRAAISYVRGLDEVDGDRIGLWGSSMSGGHVVVTAAAEPEVRAAVSQVPFADARESVSKPAPKFIAKIFLAAWRDLGRSIVGKEPLYIPAVGKTTDFAFMNTPGTWEAFERMVTPEMGWRNEIAARSIFSLGGYRPTLSAPDVRCPLLLIPARDDNLIPVESVEKLAAKAPKATLLVVDGGHFDVYDGEPFEDIVKTEADFLVEHLIGSIVTGD